jgi:prepilin-type processing-associated H-X9-DG protein
VFGFIVLAILLLTFVILLPALARMPARLPSAQEISAARRDECADNLKKMCLVFKMYSNETPVGRFPSLVHRADLWTFDPKPVYPEYFTDPGLLKCPSSASSWDSAEEYSKILEQKLVDYSRFAELAARDYVYLGWVVQGESDVQALAELRKKSGFDREAREAVVGGKTFCRLMEGVERFYTTDINNPAATSKVQSKIPVMFDAAYNHGQRGKNVIYLDGHVAFVKHGEFPVTDAVNEALGLAKAPPKTFKSSWGCYSLRPN